MRNTEINASSIAEAGLDPQKVTDLLDRVKKEVDEGLLPSAQIALARNGKLGVFETFGNAKNDSLYCVFSSTKACLLYTSPSPRD